MHRFASKNVRLENRVFAARIRSAHRGIRHSFGCSALDESVSIADLQVQMGQAIKNEDYTLAAKLRDVMQ